MEHSAFPGTNLEEEEQLLDELRSGEERAYERVVRQFTPRMLATARRILGNEEDAQDAVQDAFLSAFRNLNAFGGHARLSTWLHRIVVNAALMRLRRRQRKHEQSISELLPRYDETGHQAEPASPWGNAADQALVQRETRELLRQAINELPENYRTVLLLRDIEELSTEETARVLEVSEGVVKTRLHRARQALRTVLDRHLRGEGI